MCTPQGSGAFAFGLEDDRWPVKKMSWLVGSCMAGLPDLDSVACTEMTGSAFSSVQKKDVQAVLEGSKICLLSFLEANIKK